MDHRDDTLDPRDEPTLITGEIVGAPSAERAVTVRRGARWPLLAFGGVVAIGLGLLLTRPIDDAPSESDDETAVAQANGAGVADAPSQSTTSSALPGYGEPAAGPDLEYEITPGFDASLDQLYLLSVPVGLSAFEPEVVALGGETGTVERRLGADLWSGVGTLSRLNPGEDRHPMLVADGVLVFASLDGILVQDDALAEPVRNLGPGIAALLGPEPDQVWILGTAERTARLVDVDEPGDTATLATYDIDDVGRPLTSAGDGLIMAPKGSPLGDFIYWRPAGASNTDTADDTDDASTEFGTETIPFEGSAGAAYLGAGGSTVVFGSSETMLVYDLNDPSSFTEIPLPVDSPWGSAVSPDGSLIALTLITPLTEPNIVVIADLETGSIVSQIGSALQYQYRWSSQSTLLYMQPDWPSFRLVERDAYAGTDRNLLRFPGLNWWYAVRPTDGPDRDGDDS